VGRQLLPYHSERAPGALLAVGVKIPYSVLFPIDSLLLLHRHLQRQQQPGDIFITVPSVFWLRLHAWTWMLTPLCLASFSARCWKRTFRRAMLLSRGSFGTFLTRPISGLAR